MHSRPLPPAGLFLLLATLLAVSACVDLKRPAPAVTDLDGGTGGVTGIDVAADDGGNAKESGGASDQAEPPEDSANGEVPLGDLSAAPDAQADTSGPSQPPDLGKPVDLSSPDLAPIDAPGPDLRPALAANGVSCTLASSCDSGRCVDGVCCGQACTGACQACNLPGKLGTCSAEAAGVTCGQSSCTAGVATPTGRCDGAGACQPGTPESCGAYACFATFCASACNTSADCTAPFVCGGNVCQSSGLLLRWAFDEDGGNIVMDASGNGRNGTAIGSGASRPVATTMVAPLAYANPRSRRFQGNDGHGFLLQPMPASIRSNPEVTVSIWFRQGADTPEGADIMSINNDYILRVGSTKIEWLRRKSTTSGQIYALAAFTSSAASDGKWHHVAGTAGNDGQRLYLDGVQVAGTSNNTPTLWSSGDHVSVGYHHYRDDHFFTGELDELRIYGRVLAISEIVHLSRGQR